VNTSPIMQLCFALAILIITAEFLGVFTRRLGQPRVFGSLLAGIIIGPSLLNFLHWPVFTDTPENRLFLDHGIKILAELGVMFLMFNVGLDVHLHELLSVGRSAAFGGAIGAFAPTALGAAVLLVYGHAASTAWFAGVVLAATSVSISAQTLLEMGLLRTKEGNTVLAAAIVDDVLAILLLSFVTATVGSNAETENSASVLVIAIKMTAYLVIALAIAWYMLPYLLRRIANYEYTAQLVAPTAVVLVLLFGWSAETLGGVAAITGAFIAGVGLSRTIGEINTIIKTTANRITYALLAPIFFASIGLNADLHHFPPEAIFFTVILLLVAVLTKIIGCGFGAKLGQGVRNIEALRIGVCMISRGEVGLIILNEGLRRGVFPENSYIGISLLVVVLSTTILTPPLVRWAFRQDNNYRSSPSRQLSSSPNSP